MRNSESDLNQAVGRERRPQVCREFRRERVLPEGATVLLQAVLPSYLDHCGSLAVGTLSPPPPVFYRKGHSVNQYGSSLLNCLKNCLLPISYRGSAQGWRGYFVPKVTSNSICRYFWFSQLGVGVVLPSNEQRPGMLLHPAMLRSAPAVTALCSVPAQRQHLPSKPWTRPSIVLLPLTYFPI